MAVLRGRLGSDPDQRALTNGSSVVEIRVATNTHWTTREGERRERTDWHRVSCFGSTADFCAKYLRRGDMVAILGEIRNDVVGEGEARRTYSSVRAHELTSLTRRPPPESSVPMVSAPVREQSGAPRDDLPF